MPRNKLPISPRYYFQAELLIMLIGLFIWRDTDTT